MNTQPLGQLPVQQSQTGFAQLSGSKESLFASNLLPIPPKFAFQERAGRINWRALMNTDLEKISREVDLRTLETLLQNITFASLERDDLERLGDAHFIKLFRLSQYSIEYLLYSQNYMESLCKTLDAEYKLTYERTVKTEEIAKKFQQELKLMRKELKLKQKTLSTYEYLMKLPLEQEQEVNKCRHCPREKPKFFLNRDYLAKHYQRNHPEVDFHREFSDGSHPPAELSNTLNERTLQTTLEKQQQQAKIDQEQLFDKIKRDLFVSLSDNFKSLEKELAEVKQKADYKQIQGLLQTMESKNEEEQRRIQEQLNKPAKMLEELKSKWADMFNQQGANIKEAISSTVNEALAKRKDERDKKRLDKTKNSDNSQENISQIQEQKIKFFEQRINEFDSKFQENERIKKELEEKLKVQKKLLEDKEQQEKALQEQLVLEIERRKEQEKERILSEQRLIQQLQEKEKQSLLSEQEAEQMRIKMLKEMEEQKARDQLEKQRLSEQEAKQKQDEERIQRDRQEKIEKERADKLKEQEQKEEQMKLALQLKQKQEQEEAERKLREEQQSQNKQQVESDVEIIEEEEEEEDDNENEDQQKIIDAQRKADAERILNEDKPPVNKPALVDPKVSLKQTISKSLSKELQKGTNIFEGERAHLKSLFNHPPAQISSQRQDILVESLDSQIQLLEQEFEDLKIKPTLPADNPLTKSRKDDLKNVADDIKGINAKDTERVKNSIEKRLHDQDYAPYSAMIDEFLKRSLN